MIWLVLGWFVLFIQETATRSENLNPDSTITLTPAVFAFASLAVALIGFLVGILEVFWLGNRFRSRSFSRKLLYKLAFYSCFMLLVILIAYPLAAALELGASPLNEAVMEKFWNFLSSVEFLSTMVAIAFSLFLSLFYSEISDNIGHGVLMNFFTGKYHQPREEYRIFLFSDMKSSTSVAESLGHARYFEYLRAYYSDFSDAIVRHSGEVYQYVGDEVIVSFTHANGVRGANCIRCFFAMQAALDKNAQWYMDTFGIVPEFKAALHVGRVTTGEIGALKKAIFFTGDVLNTTARMQALCNSYGVKVLISGELLGDLPQDGRYTVAPLGTQDLKGREKPVDLFTVSPAAEM